MTDLTAVLVSSLAANGALGVILYFARKDLAATREAWHHAQNSAAQAQDLQEHAEHKMEEVSKIHQELLSRPVQAIIPANAIQVIAEAIITYMSGDAHTAF